MSRAEDPGWKSAFLGGLFILIPGFGARRTMKSSNGLVVMRQLWCTFISAMLLIGVVVIFVDRQLEDGGMDGRLVAGFVVVIGVVTQLAGFGFLPAISGKNTNAVRSSAQARFFLRIALAEVPAFVGFFGFILTTNPWVYAAGFAIGFAGMLDARPSAAWIDRGQQQLQADGSDVSLLAALTGGGITR